jgi:hypothetical protein
VDIITTNLKQLESENVGWIKQVQDKGPVAEFREHSGLSIFIAIRKMPSVQGKEYHGTKSELNEIIEPSWPV